MGQKFGANCKFLLLSGAFNGKIERLCGNWFLIDPSFHLLSLWLTGLPTSQIETTWWGFFSTGVLQWKGKVVQFLTNLYQNLPTTLWRLGLNLDPKIILNLWNQNLVFLRCWPGSKISPIHLPPLLWRVGGWRRQWGSDSNRAQGTWGALIK